MLPLPQLQRHLAWCSVGPTTLRRMVRVGGRWGPARKSLNLFLRDVTYNYLLRDAHGLARREAELEVPLAGIVMSKIRGCGHANLPEISVVSLTSAVSAGYQQAASTLAQGFRPIEHAPAVTRRDCDHVRSRPALRALPRDKKGLNADESRCTLNTQMVRRGSQAVDHAFDLQTRLAEIK